MIKKDAIYTHKTAMNIHGKNFLSKSKSSEDEQTPKENHLNQNTKFMIIESSRELIEQESSEKKSNNFSEKNKNITGEADLNYVL